MLDASTRPGRGPRLLITGPPGHGNTVALLEIAELLAGQHEDRFGVPVVLDLATWRKQDDDLQKWIVRSLCAPGGIAPYAEEPVTAWVDAGQIAPLLDGLDEITDESARRRCLEAINRFLDRLPAHTALVVAPGSGLADLRSGIGGPPAARTAAERAWTSAGRRGHR